MITNRIITAATPITVISTANAKLQLRLESDYDAENDLITAYINAATLSCENYINGHIQPKAMVLWLDQFHNVVLDTYPISVTSVEYYKKDEVSLTTLPTTDWYVTTTEDKKNTLVIKEVPTNVEDDRPDVVKITTAIGYTDADNVPEPIKQAIRLQLTDMFERREDRAGTPVTTSQNLLRPYRNYL